MNPSRNFARYLDQLWVVHEEYIWSPDRGWRKVAITAADCAFLASCNIRWN